MRRPDENRERVYDYLLAAQRPDVRGGLGHRRGRRRVPGRAGAARGGHADELDRILGCVLEYADGAFNSCSSSASARPSAASGPGG